ncbi:MAG TPA: hypothetical protein VIC27_08395, partial [Ktedonobacterales bacterium]
IFPHIAVTGGIARGVVALAVGLGVGIPFAYVAYQLVERPFLRWRRASGAHEPPPAQRANEPLPQAVERL